MCRAGGGVILFAALFVPGVARGQGTPPAQPQNPPPAMPGAVPVEKQTPQGTTTCLQPLPPVSWEDYEGPFAKVVGLFGRRLERNEVSPRSYVPGTVLCTLEVKSKFLLFVENTIDPVTFLSAAFNAGISQAQNTDPSYGQGAAGYGKRVGFNIIDQAQSDFFNDFAYPTIFHEDPRYYRLGSGSVGHRLLHAAAHAVIAYRTDGTEMPNYSLWFGTTSSTALSNVYHPDHRRGFAPTAESVGYSVGQDIGFDVLREFWPEIARTFRLPFRDQNQAAGQSTPGTQP